MRTEVNCAKCGGTFRYGERHACAPAIEPAKGHPACGVPQCGLCPKVPDTKPTNPKDAAGSLKAFVFSVIPQRVVAELGLALLEGALKYSRHNYRRAGVRASVYVDATGRHLAAWWEGQDTDPDSGLSHVTKAIASLTVLRDSMLQGNWVDDRPPKASDAEDWIKAMNAKAAEIIARNPAPKPPCTEIDGVLER